MQLRLGVVVMPKFSAKTVFNISPSIEEVKMAPDNCRKVNNKSTATTATREVTRTKHQNANAFVFIS